jgi:hypothetical protein
MSKLILRRFGIIVESRFQNPIPFSEELNQKRALKALERFRRVGLMPSAITVSTADRLFRHQFDFTLGKCSFHINAERLEIKCLDGLFPDEVGQAGEFIEQALQIIELTKGDATSFQMYAHAEYKTEADRKEFMREVVLPNGITVGGLIAYSTVEGWSQEIRCQMDRSVIIKDGLFMIFGTTTSDLITKEIFSTVYKSFETFARRMGITVEMRNGQQSTS